MAIAASPKKKNKQLIDPKTGAPSDEKQKQIIFTEDEGEIIDLADSPEKGSSNEENKVRQNIERSLANKMNVQKVNTTLKVLQNKIETTTVVEFTARACQIIIKI